MKLRFAALSDVGRVRRDNQDSGYAGPHLLMVADGVGGAARGDVASSTTVEALRPLDQGRTDGDAMAALAGAIHRTHDKIVEQVADDPELDGTSTTVTAGLFDGSHLAMAHLGDSRAYLLRDGELQQLTKDHSFVQSLIDEGRITEDEARTHPHRNLILRALDGVREPEPDLFVVDVQEGDRLLFCSDGCCGVLTPDALSEILGTGSVDEATVALIQASLDAGSTDNVTVVVADVLADDAPDDPDAAASIGPMLVGAAGEQARHGRLSSTTGSLPPVSSGDSDDREDSARPIDPEEARYAPRPPRRFLGVRRLVLAVLVLGLIGAIGFGAYRWTQKQYYVSNDADTVAIYRGVDLDFPGIKLRHVEERSTITLSQLPTLTQREVRTGITASDLADARKIVTRLKADVCPTPAPTPTPAVPTAPTSPTAPAAPAASPSPAPPATPGAKPPPPAPTPSPTASVNPDCEGQ